MAFVNESIPAEQKAKFDFKVFRNPHIPSRPISTSRWTVDHDRNVFLLRLGGGGPWEGGDAPMPREYLVLCWKGDVIKFEALCSGEGPISNWSSRWEVLVVHIPPHLEAQRDMILKFIHEGLETMASPSAHAEGCSKVTVSFNLPIQQ